MFDLRSLEHSTIIYESADLVPLLRLGWNKQVWHTHIHTQRCSHVCFLQDHNYLATILMDQSKVVILDIRAPSLPVAELKGHSSCVNSIAWAPHSSCHVCTAGDDSQALIWDLSQMPKPVEGMWSIAWSCFDCRLRLHGFWIFIVFLIGSADPILAYTAASEINTLQWSSSQPDWVAIAFDRKLQILRV